MESFTLTLANGATLTGLSNLPPPSATTPKQKPLIVGLHGASYSASYFDVDTNHTASLLSNALSVPFVAINRPGYASSTSFYPLPPNSSDFETHALWLHEYILPALWKTFGPPQGCTSLVLLCHSLSTPGAVIAASYFSTSSPNFTTPPYPLAGLIFSGFGTSLLPSAIPDPSAPPPPDVITFPAAVKDAMFLPPGTCDPAIYAHHSSPDSPLNTSFPSDEVTEIHTLWLPRIKTPSSWARSVTVPVMFGVAERDCYWQATGEHVEEMRGVFSGSERVEGGVVKGAPHNMEMSWWGRGWYARCFGFGLECAAGYESGVGKGEGGKGE